MRFRPLFALGVGAMVIAVPTDRGTPPEQEGTVPEPNVVPPAVAVPLLCRADVCCSRGRPHLIWASRCEWSFSSHMRKYRQPTEGGSR